MVASVCNCVQLCRTKPCMMLVSHQVSQSALQCWQQLSCSDIHVILEQISPLRSNAAMPCLLDDMVPGHDVLVK